MKKDNFNYRQEYYIRDYLIIQNCGNDYGMSYNGITILKLKENEYAEEYMEVYHATLENEKQLTIKELKDYIKLYETLKEKLPDIIKDDEEENDDI